MILALTTGMIGSSSPARISVCWRIKRQREQAGPHRSRKQLMQVAHPRTRHQLAVEQLLDHRRIVADRAAVDVTRDRGCVVVIQEPARRQHLRQDRRPAGNHDCARPGGHQDQPAAAPRILEGELLGQRSSPRQARERRPARRSRSFATAPQHRRQVRKAVRQRRVRRAAGAGHVEAHHRRIGIQLLHERIEELPGWRRCRCTAPAATPVPGRMSTRIC